MASTHLGISDFEFRISDLPSRSQHPLPGSHGRRGAVADGPSSRGPPSILPARGIRSLSPGTALTAPLTPYNQPRMPFSTPTSRKASVGVAQRGFPRAGGRGVGAGKKALDVVRAPECSPPARQRRAALEDGGTEEHSCSEGAPTENAWPRSKTADGGHGNGHPFSRNPGVGVFVRQSGLHLGTRPPRDGPILMGSG